ncbi:MAG: OmpA family protein [Bacterioplanes sp.]|nr:OmpA family protein [Bacterioplanes sp.]
MKQNRPAANPLPVSHSQEEDSWFITYLDTITIMLVMFVVMVVLSGPPNGNRNNEKPNETSTQARPDTSNSTNPTLAPWLDGGDRVIPLDTPSRFTHGLLGDDIEVIEQPGSIRFRINSELLFASATAELHDAAYDVLDQLQLLLIESEMIITVSGHTDNRPISTVQFPSNWELSSARAGSVVRYLIESGLAPERFKVEGMASTQALASNATDVGRARNRRVEITLERPD